MVQLGFLFCNIQNGGNVEAMDDHFPTFNYPFHPDGPQQQSFIDYGSCPSYDLDIKENDRSVYTRSRHYHYLPNEQFVGIQVTLPLFLPSNTVYSSRILPEPRPYRPTLRSDFRTLIIEQLSDFYRDYPDDAFPVGRHTVNRILDCEPWNMGYFNKLKPQEHQELSQKEFRTSKYEIERFVKSFVTNPLYYNSGLKNTKNHSEIRVPEALILALLDIHPDLLFEIMSESIQQQKKEMLYFDIFQGNILAFCTLPGNLSSNGVLFYPSGPNLETLNMTALRFEDKGDKIPPKPCFVNPCDKIVGYSAIRQIEAICVENSGVLVATRSLYSCRFSKLKEYDNKQISLDLVDKFQCEDELVDLSLSPYIHGDAVVVTNKGYVHIWKCGHRTDSINCPSPALDDGWSWYQSVYGGHPRCIVISNSIEADMLDLRTNKLPQSLFSIKSKQVDLHERISALQRHPNNTHYYFITTDQSALVMDDRFLQHPLLKWHHHLQDPVQFIDVLPNITNSDDTIITLSGSIHRETHCFQYSCGQITPTQTFMLLGNDVNPPPVSTCLPWKVCSYDVWPSLLSSSILPLSSVVENRVKNSLVGLTCIPQENSTFTVLQMSSLGDLFYQPFTSKKELHNNSQTDSLFSDENLSFCKDWIKDLVEKESTREQSSSLKTNTIESDCSSQFESLISLETPHSTCALCIEDLDKSEKDLDTTNLSETVCPRCGIGVMTGLQLQKARKKKTITTSNNCLFSQPHDDLNIFPEENEFQNSISQGFRYNWISEEPRPIALTDEEKVESKHINDDDIVKSINDLTDKPETNSRKDKTVVPELLSSHDFATETMETTFNNASNFEALKDKVSKETTQMTLVTKAKLPIATNTTEDHDIISRVSNQVTMETIERGTISNNMLTPSPSKTERASPTKSKRKKLGLSMGF